MTIPHFLKLLGKSAAAWNEDDCSGMGAAIAFYTLFSIAPLLVIVIGHRYMDTWRVTGCNGHRP